MPLVTAKRHFTTYLTFAGKSPFNGIAHTVPIISSFLKLLQFFYNLIQLYVVS